MNIILNLLNEYIVLADIKEKKLLSIIDNDAGLIRYLIQIIREYIFTENNDGYIQAIYKLEGQTLLHRIIIEYYAQFDKNLFEILNNPKYEVNHKNKNIWDNRLENLEIVTKLGNIKHENNVNYTNEIVFTTNELLNIRERLKKEEQYKLDVQYLTNVDINNRNILNNNGPFGKFFDSLYLLFNSVTLNQTKIAQDITESKQLSILECIIFSYTENNIFYNYSMKQNTVYLYTVTEIVDSYYYNLIKHYEEYYTYTLLYNNLKVLVEYAEKHTKEYENNLLPIFMKYNIHNPKYNNSKIEEYYKHNILFDFFQLLVHNLPFKIYKNKILTTLSIKDLFITYRIHQTFTVLYYLGLLIKEDIPQQNQKYFNSLSKEDRASFFIKDKHIPSFIVIPRWTEQTFIIANKRAKKLLKANLSTITHHNIQKNFDEETADNIYKSKKCKQNTKRAISSTEDVNNILLSFKEEIQQNGFIFVEEILEELEFVNEKRKQNGQPFNTIYPSSIKFIRRILKDIPETKDILKELKVQYTILNKETMEQIKKYREKNNIKIPLTNEFKVKKQILVLKKLVRK